MQQRLKFCMEPTFQRLVSIIHLSEMHLARLLVKGEKWTFLGGGRDEALAGEATMEYQGGTMEFQGKNPSYHPVPLNATLHIYR